MNSDYDPNTKMTEARDEREEALDGLKERINNILWEILPDSTTIAKAEKIAIGFHSDIAAEWMRHEGL